MDQDFAKRRTRVPLAEPSPVPQSSSLGLLLTGLVTGIAVGLFIALLVYMSGALPPAPGQPPQTADATLVTPPVATTDANAGGLTEEQQREAQRLQLEFYQELPNYEVVVDVTPIAGSTPRAPATAVSPPAPAADPAAGDIVADAGTERETDDAATEDENAAPALTPEPLDPVSAALLEIASRADAQPASPVPAASSNANFMLQAGAFQQQATATAQLNR